MTNKLSVLTNNKIYIAEKSEGKIRDIKNQKELNQLSLLISKWAMLVGEKIPAEELMLIREFIIRNYGNLNFTDLNECMNLVVSQEIEVNYYKFASLYIGKCLNAYKEHKKNIIHKIDQEHHKTLKMLPLPKSSEKDSWENISKIINFFYMDFRTGKPIIDLGNVAYDFVMSTKFIEKNEANNKVYNDYLKLLYEKQETEKRAANFKKKLGQTINNEYYQSDKVLKKTAYLMLFFSKFPTAKKLNEFLNSYKK